jgi:hypothetical protein
VIRAGAVTTGDIALAVARVPRYAPDRFSSLPPTVRDAFVAIACQVPQNTLTGGPSNVIEGEFATKGQRDWAALCSNGTLTEIRIVWGGPVRCEDRLASRQDSDSIATTAPGVVSYVRSIDVAARGSAHDVLRDTVDRAMALHSCDAGHWQLVTTRR